LSVDAPVPLTDAHRLDLFHCTEPNLASWLKQRALKNQQAGASRTFVVCEGQKVIGFYCLSAGSVNRSEAPGGIRRNMPEPIPVVVLGRLAVDSRWTGQGIGRGMLKDAVLRTAGVAEQLGVRALLCHAISADAKAFYLQNGFLESPLHPMTLLLPIGSVE
jgi:GNAT superfamily N-acetyltransferase